MVMEALPGVPIALMVPLVATVLLPGFWPPEEVAAAAEQAAAVGISIIPAAVGQEAAAEQAAEMHLQAAAGQEERAVTKALQHQPVIPFRLQLPTVHRAGKTAMS